MRVPNIHFEPESRQLQRARLEHLLSFSDMVLLLVAEQGLGKSHLLNQLKPEQNPMQPSWVHLVPETAVDVTQLLQALVAQLGISCEPSNRSRLTALHQYAQQLVAVDDRLHICIDDADFLTDNALELLINFSKIETAAPRILLTGLPEFEQRFFDREFNRLLEGSLHVEHLLPYTAEEARGFVDAHLYDGSQLKDAEYRRLLLESQGRPDQLKAALAKLIDGASRSTKFKLKVTNLWYWAGIALVLATTAGAVGYLYIPNPQVEPEVLRPLEIPIPQTVQAEKAPEPELVEARSELAKRLEAQEKRLAAAARQPAAPKPEPEPAPVLKPDQLAAEAPEPPVVVSEIPPEEPQQVVAEAQISDVEVVVDTPVIEVPESPVIETTQLPPGTEVASVTAEVETPKQIEPKPASKPLPAPVTPAPKRVEVQTSLQTLSADIDRVLSWPATDLSVQLLAAREEASADKLIARYGSQTPLLKLSYPYKGAMRYTVVTGHYASRSLANQAVAQLPEGLQKLKPWIRSVAGLKDELNTVLNP